MEWSAEAVVIDDVMYRYEDVAYAAPFDETGTLPGTVKVELRTYKVVKRTPKGAWVVPIYAGHWHADDDRRFVLAKSRKRFACPTIEEARASFVARKRAQIRIYKARIERAESALRDFNRSVPSPSWDAVRDQSEMDLEAAH